MTDKTVEAVARAIFAVGYSWPWEQDTSESGDNDRDIALAEAQAAITAHTAALEAEGIVMMPIKPTPEMCEAVAKEPGFLIAYNQKMSCTAEVFYGAMIAASRGE